MPRQLLPDALERAEPLEPVDRAAALLHIARVWTAFDRAEAERTLERGIALAGELPEEYRSIILCEAIPLTAAVSPQRALDLSASVPGTRFRGLDTIIFTMLDHGHIGEAVEILETLPSASGYPFMAAGQAMAYSRNNADQQIRILRGAMRAIRELWKLEHQEHQFSEFRTLFARHWRILPADEATAFLRELTDWILQEPDTPTSDSISHGADRILFTSSRESSLFQIISPLRRLDAELGEALISVHSQLANAVARYPYGHEEEFASMDIPDDAREHAPREPIEWDEVGLQWIPATEWLKTTFDDLFQKAMDLYAVDTDAANPNRAPRECWPSTQTFRGLLYRAGRHEGRAAITRLERIPDDTVRLFVQIELAAALLNLPMIGGQWIAPQPLQHPAETFESMPPLLAGKSVRWKERGHPSKVRVETAEWDADGGRWNSPRESSLTLFRMDGQHTESENHNADGTTLHCRYEYNPEQRLTGSQSWQDTGPRSQTECTYDDRGRIVRVALAGIEQTTTPIQPQNLPSFGGGFMMHWSVSMMFPMEAGEVAYQFEGVASIATTYNDRDRPIETLYHDREGRLLCRVTSTWNANGLLEREVLSMGDESTSEFQFPDRRITYAYDEQGRCSERKSEMDGLGTMSARFAYDDHDNPVEMISEQEEQGPNAFVRYAYAYDAQGNWTERVTWKRSVPDGDFLPSKIDRRTIEYFDAASGEG